MILQNKIINKNTQQQVNRMSLQSIVGKGYAEYWHCKHYPATDEWMKRYQIGQSPFRLKSL